MSDVREVKNVLLELAKDEGWTWERLETAVILAMRQIEGKVVAERAVGFSGRKELMPRKGDTA